MSWVSSDILILLCTHHRVYLLFLWLYYPHRYYISSSDVLISTNIIQHIWLFTQLKLLFKCMSNASILVIPSLWRYPNITLSPSYHIYVSTIRFILHTCRIYSSIVTIIPHIFCSCLHCITYNHHHVFSPPGGKTLMPVNFSLCYDRKYNIIALEPCIRYSMTTAPFPNPDIW